MTHIIVIIWTPHFVDMSFFFFFFFLIDFRLNTDFPTQFGGVYFYRKNTKRY